MSKIYYKTHVGVPQEYRPKNALSQLRFFHSGLRRRGAGAGISKGKFRHFSGRKSNSAIKKFLLGPQKGWDPAGGSANRLCWISPCLLHLVCITMLK